MPKPLSISCAPEQERAGRKVPGESEKSPAPCHHFSFLPSCHKGLGGGRKSEQRSPCPRFGPCYLMLLFPTRQMGVSSHHPNRLQARTTRASSSVTTIQVSKTGAHQCLPYPSPKPLPASCPFSILHLASPERGLPSLWMNWKRAP